MAEASDGYSKDQQPLGKSNMAENVITKGTRPIAEGQSLLVSSQVTTYRGGSHRTANSHSGTPDHCLGR